MELNDRFVEENTGDEGKDSQNTLFWHPVLSLGG
jgi:hypothetical protein